MQRVLILFLFLNLLTTSALAMLNDALPLEQEERRVRPSMRLAIPSRRDVAAAVVSRSIPSSFLEFARLSEADLYRLTIQSVQQGEIQFGSLVSGGAVLSPDFPLPGDGTAELWLGGSEEVSFFVSLVDYLPLLGFLDDFRTIELPDREKVQRVLDFNLEANATCQRLVPGNIRRVLLQGKALLAAAPAGSTLEEGQRNSFRNLGTLALRVLDSFLRSAEEQGVDLTKIRTKRILVVNVAFDCEPSDSPSVLKFKIGRPSLRTSLREGDRDSVRAFLENDALSQVRTIFEDWVDHPDFDVEPHLDFLRETLRLAHARGELVFVHCRMGRSRSAVLVLEYLMSLFQGAVGNSGQLFQQTFQWIVTRRSELSLNLGFHITLELRGRSYESFHLRKDTELEGVRPADLPAMAAVAETSDVVAAASRSLPDATGEEELFHE